jgi:hypothetical protein
MKKAKNIFLGSLIMCALFLSPAIAYKAQAETGSADLTTQSDSAVSSDTGTNNTTKNTTLIKKPPVKIPAGTVKDTLRNKTATDAKINLSDKGPAVVNTSATIDINNTTTAKPPVTEEDHFKGEDRIRNVIASMKHKYDLINTLIGKVESRITKLTSEGKDTSASTKLIAQAKVDLGKAKTDWETLSTTWKEMLANIPQEDMNFLKCVKLNNGAYEKTNPPTCTWQGVKYTKKNDGLKAEERTLAAISNNS